MLFSFFKSFSALPNRCDPEALSAYFDGELSERAARDVDAHLATCAGCRAELDAFRRLRGVFAAWHAPAPRPFFVERLNRRLERPQRGQAFRWAQAFLPRLAPAALVVLILGAAVFLADRISPDPEPIATVETFLNRSLDPDALEVVTLTEASLSQDRVLDLVIAGGSR